MELIDLKNSLYLSYCRELCYPGVRDLWNDSNKTLGMCAITSLVVNDYFGGDVCKIKVDGVSHYFNLVNDEIIDLTSSQFCDKILYDDYVVVERDSFVNEETMVRYLLLIDKVKLNLSKLVDEQVNSCTKCLSLVEKFPNASTLYFGVDNNIVLVGEAPANNGWRKSNKLWRNIEGKVLPSGVILQKLFDIINRDIFDTTFLEAVKCYPVDRKNLKQCSNNCKEYMFKQLELLQPNLIITLGEFPTRVLLDFKFDKFSSVVGNIYEIGEYKILPIYHPSPISPKSYKGNEPIFFNLQI